MKKKFGGIIPRIIFLGLSAFIFVVWLNSLLDPGGNFEGTANKLRLSQQEALASTNDFQEAYDESLYDDTMYVEDVSAAPGESFWVTLGISNRDSIAGWRAMLEIPTDRIYPDIITHVDTSDEGLVETTYTITTEKAPRVMAPMEWSIFHAAPRYGHEDTLRATALIYLDPYGGESSPPLPPGPAAVMRFKFWVKEDVVPEQWGLITFLPLDILPNQQANPANTFTDKLGETELCPQVRGGTFTVAGEPGNNAPVFTEPYIWSFQVYQGETLEFDVTAWDEDGDTITLSMDPLDLSGSTTWHFDTKQGVGSVTQRFEYQPGYDEPPGFKDVRFVAVDEHGARTEKDATIEVQEAVQDLLMASSLQGGVPGCNDRPVPFMITNSVDIYGFQFTFRWDAAKLWVDPDSLVRTHVIEGFSLWHNVDNSEGKATVLVFGLAGQTIPPGLDTVVSSIFSVVPDAEPGEVDILLENAREATIPGYPSQAMGVVDGKFFIDMFGDANSDQMVDVGDVVSLVHYLLGTISFNSRQELAADANRDSFIDVGDLVAMIDMILGRWMGPSPPMYPGPMAVVKLDYGDLVPGSFGELQVMAELEVPVAGAQLEINYDPDEVSFQVPVLSQRSDHCLIEYRDDGKGRLRLLLYNMSNEPIPTGKGSIVSLPVTLGPYAEKRKIELKQVVLADQKAASIPVGDHIYVPTGFELSQNYPNPFNPWTTIRFTLPSQQEGGLTLPTTLKIYNVLGEVVRTLVDEPMAPGAHEVVWDGKDDQGDQTASGIYFYRLRAGDLQDTKKMVLMR